MALPKTPPRAPRADSVGFAIVGLGDYALNQMMPRFEQSPRSHIAAIVSGNPGKLRSVGEAYGVPEDARYSYDDFDRIAKDKRVDAVYIVLPTGLHAEWTEKAFAVGKHVLCEKPMALSSAECSRMIAASERAKRKLMIAYRCHFEPHNLLAMDLMAQKALGPLRIIRSDQEYRMGPVTPAQNWRLNRALAGGGPLEDFGLYGLQAALYLTQEMPELITASAFRPENDARFTEVFAHVGTHMRFPSGAVAQLSTSYDAAGANIIYARGTTGKLIMDPAIGYSGHKMRLEQAGQPDRDLTPGDPDVQFARQLDHFVAAIRDNSPIKTPGELGLRDVRLIEAIYASAETGRNVWLNPDGTMRT
ncbi:Gfo/Idh/MocA family oxidoreductase [Asticcacaulis sp. SL142]|uniref:Gfo/Idh/MocA family protein n=1 Tax=Asticcacaulis sp. SL142 TaxID=2995155 RepID=UPI00226D0228|nr:Gfo/Idh/MocA family oxidoreductase [Asticcacaulis sp. SL142]WAC47997.1 Gfo/Idh/MocA family oxidoreductase [Asticcacaulis sp. SL142]